MATQPINFSSTNRSIFISDNAFLFYLALVKLIIHLAANFTGGYGYFRDELYYIACSDHMAWGYVDQPPLSIALLWLSRLLFGGSIFAMRLLPAISGATVVFLAGLITREIGGKRYAQFLTAICTIAGLSSLGMDSFFSMNSFDSLFWTLSIYFIILIIKKDGQKNWLLLGLSLGLGLLNKISILWLIAGLIVGLLLTPERKLLLTKNFWIAAAIAFFLFLPHIIWQILNDFPTLEFMRNAGSDKYVSMSPLNLFIEQALSMNPLTLPIWFAGLIYFLVSKNVRQFRILSIIYITVFLILVINGTSKSEYLVPVFPMLFALGAIAAEKFILRFNWRWLKPIVPLPIILSTIILSPVVIPVMPVEEYIAYSKKIGVAPSTSEKKKLSKLPQHYADMFGWEDMVKEIAVAYNKLSPEEKAKCAMLCNNYGEAGAVDFFGPKYGLPRAISRHNNYWIWGPGNATGEVVIRLGNSAEKHRETFAEVIQAGFFSNEYCMPYENDMPIWICKNRRMPLKEDWAQIKNFN